MCREFVRWAKSFRPRNWNKLDQSTVMMPPQVLVLKSAETVYISSIAVYTVVAGCVRSAVALYF